MVVSVYWLVWIWNLPQFPTQLRNGPLNLIRRRADYTALSRHTTGRPPFVKNVMTQGCFTDLNVNILISVQIQTKCYLSSAVFLVLYKAQLSEFFFPMMGETEMRGVKLIEKEGWQGNQQIRLFPFWRRDNMGACYNWWLSWFLNVPRKQRKESVNVSQDR